jgi:hypothetical protein
VEPDIFSLVSETSAAHVDPVFPHDAMRVLANSAASRVVTEFSRMAVTFARHYSQILYLKYFNVLGIIHFVVNHLANDLKFIFCVGVAELVELAFSVVEITFQLYEQNEELLNLLLPLLDLL